MKPFFLSLRRMGVLALLVIFRLSSSYASAPVDSYRIVATYPHSVESYTEGFFYLNGIFYEGTGVYGHSALMAIQPATGKVLQKLDLSDKYFGEGIVDWGPNIYEWTWQSHICFVYDRFSLRLIKQFTYTGEGWGMTRTAKEIITSDGSDTLRFRNPETFAETRHIVVHDGARAIGQLNELEYIQRPNAAAEVYANIWYSNRIAYDAQHDRLFVTGKQWPRIFEIQVVSRSLAKMSR